MLDVFVRVRVCKYFLFKKTKKVMRPRPVSTEIIFRYSTKLSDLDRISAIGGAGGRVFPLCFKKSLVSHPSSLIQGASILNRSSVCSHTHAGFEWGGKITRFVDKRKRTAIESVNQTKIFEKAKEIYENLTNDDKENFGGC